MSLVSSLVLAALFIGGTRGQGEVTATLAPQPLSDVEPGDPTKQPPGVGAPILWEITVNAAPAARLAAEPQLGLEWTVASAQVARTDDAATFSWTLIPLSGGELRTPEVSFVLDSTLATLVAPARAITVAAALAAGEDAARPLPPFREPKDTVRGGPARVIALGALAALLVGFILWRRGKARRMAMAASQEQSEATVSPLDRIQQLDPVSAPGRAVAALGPLVRAAIDESAHVDRSHLTDDEWADAEGIRAAGDPRGADAAALVRQSGIARYRGDEPTSFAAKEAVERALGLLRATRTGSSDGEAA